MRHKQKNSSEQGYESTAHHLLNKWADINLHETQTKKLPYIKQGNLDYKALYNCLMNKGAEINSCDRNKNTILQKANKRGHESITQLLLNKETDTSPCNKKTKRNSST